MTTHAAFWKTITLALFLGGMNLTLPAVAQTQDPAVGVQAGDLALKGAFIRATLPRAKVGAAYVIISNDGETDERLLSVTASVGDRAVVHEMVKENDVMTMRSLPDGLLIPAGETVSLIPGVTHIMIYGLEAPLVVGQAVDLTLTFETVGEVEVSFDVLKMNARSHPDMELKEEHRD